MTPMTPLTVEELAFYIKEQLRRVREERMVFASDALAQIAKLSKGVPRVVNSLCKAALLNVALHGEQVVGVTHVDSAWIEVNGWKWFGKLLYDEQIKHWRFEDRHGAWWLHSGDTLALHFEEAGIPRSGLPPACRPRNPVHAIIQRVVYRIHFRQGYFVPLFGLTSLTAE